MKENQSEAQFQMQLTSINVLKFAQYDVKEFDVSKDEAIEFQSQFDVKVIEKSKMIRLDCTIKVRVLELDECFCELKVASMFRILPFEAILKKESDEYQLPNILILNLFNIATGTVRGILHEKLRGTVLQHEVLPLINIQEMIGFTKAE